MRQLGDRSGADGADQGGLVDWYGVVAPANTPHEILNRLSAEFFSGAKSPEVVAKYEVQGLRVTAMNQERFGAAMKADMAMWGKVVNATGFTTQNESIVLPSTACMMAAPQYEPLFTYTAFCYSRPSI